MGFVHPRGRSLDRRTGPPGIRTGRKSDAIVVITDHSSVDYEMAARYVVVVDTRALAEFGYEPMTELAAALAASLDDYAREAVRGSARALADRGAR
jgi:hypothetical protein